jgi:hypothetical protein
VSEDGSLDAAIDAALATRSDVRTVRGSFLSHELLLQPEEEPLAFSVEQAQR